MRTMYLDLLLALAASVLGAASAGAQSPRERAPMADSTPARILARAGSYRAAPWLVDILRQVAGPQPRAKLDEIADSLVQRTLSVRSAAEPGHRTGAAERAFLALIHAGSLAAKEGTPYDGALERLIRIHEESTWGNMRTAALFAMTRVAGQERALSYYRDVAAGLDPTAPTALSILARQASGIPQLGGTTPSTAGQRAAMRLLEELRAPGRVKGESVKRELAEWFALRKAEGTSRAPSPWSS